MDCQLSRIVIAAVLTFALRGNAQPKEVSSLPSDIGPVPLEPLARASDEDLRQARINLRLSKQEFALLEPIRVIVEVHNLAEADLRMPARGIPAKDFVLVVRDARGNLVPLTRAGHKDYDRPPIERTGGIRTRISKGKPATAELFVNSLYDLTIPGKYELTAFCYVGQRNGERVVKIESTPVQLIVGGDVYQADDKGKQQPERGR